MDRGLTAYKAAVDALFARTGSTAKFGLERTASFLEILGDPHRQFASFHVAGTNGKGSAVVTLYELLRAKGLSVGRYMSPHLIDFRERIVVDGEAVSEHYVVEFLERCADDAERMGATFFEITTAMAFHYFAEQKVDVGVIETGLGGRLDSTNVITPVAAGITSIGLDHQEYLGSDEESIAREKAGIFKRGVPAVVGRVSRPARRSIADAAAAKDVVPVDAEDLYATSNVSITLDGTRFTVSHNGEQRALTTGLVGRAQAANVSVALAMLDAAGEPYSVSLDEAAETLPRVKLAGRFQRVGNMILDVAHNPEGIRGLVANVKETAGSPMPVVLGVLADKDWKGMIAELRGLVDRLILVLPRSAPKARSWDPNTARDFATSLGIDAIVNPVFEDAIRMAASSGQTVLVTGSFHTVGDALQVLGEKTL